MDQFQQRKEHIFIPGLEILSNINRPYTTGSVCAGEQVASHSGVTGADGAEYLQTLMLLLQTSRHSFHHYEVKRWREHGNDLPSRSLTHTHLLLVL